MLCDCGKGENKPFHALSPSGQGCFVRASTLLADVSCVANCIMNGARKDIPARAGEGGEFVFLDL